MTSTDAFVGTWELDATQNQYQFGDALQQGLYIIAPKQHGYLVTMQWTNSAGRSFELSYEATPDGNEYPANAPGIDKQSMTRVDEKHLIVRQSQVRQLSLMQGAFYLTMDK